MKLTLYSRFLGLGLALLASAAMAQAPTPPITSLSSTATGVSSTNNIQWSIPWFDYHNWSNGFVNGAGSVAWLNQPLSINPTIADYTQSGTSVAGTTAAIPLTGGIPTNNSLTVTDGVATWSQSKGSSSPTTFNVSYDPSTVPPSIKVTDNTNGLKLIISYSTSTVPPGKFYELVGTTDGIHTVFTKTLSATPLLTTTNAMQVADGTYVWTADGTVTNGMANGQSVDPSADPTSDFMVQYVVATRQMTVTYTATGAATTGAGQAINANYTPTNSGALGVTLGTLGIGDQSGSNTVSLRLNSLTMNNNGAMAQLNKSIGATGDEIASGIHLVNPLGLAVRTGGDFTSSLRLSGNVDGPSGIVKMDSGNVTFTGNNTFTGPTIVRDTGGTVYLRSGLMLYNCTTTLGSNSVTCQSVSGLEVGMSVSGTTATANFIQPGAVVTSISLPVAPLFISSFTMNLVATGTASSQTLTAKSTSGVTLAGCKAAAGSTTVTAASTAGLAVGMSLTGTSMPTSAVVMGISGDGVTFSINHAAPATTTAAAGETIIATQVPRLNLTQTLTNATTTAGSPTITLVPLPAGAGASTTAGLVLGAPVTGPGIPGGATIASITNSTQFVITAPATAAVGSTLKIGSATTAASTTVACANTAGLSPGMTITGVNMPSGAVVLSVTDATHFVINSATALSGTALTLIAQAPAGLAITNCVMDPGTGQAFTGCATTAGSATVTTPSTAGLVAGMTLTGPNLPVSAVVSTITSTSFTLTNVATGTGTGLTLVARSVPSFNLSLTLTNGSTVSGSAFVSCASPLTAGLVVGAPISGPNIPVGATIAQAPSGNSFQISPPATATGSGLTFVVGGTTTATSNIVACASTAGLVSGMSVSGPNIPSGATVLSITNGTTFTLSTPVVIGGVGQPLTAQSVANIDLITCTSTTNLAAGMAVNGPNMPSGAFITAINSPTSFSINTEPLRSASGVMLFATSGGDVTLTHAATTNNSTTVACDSTLGLVVGMAVTGTNVQSSAVVAGITDATHFTLSLPATATATGLTLAGGTYALSSSQIYLGTANRDGNSTVVLQLAASNQINDTSVIYFDGASSRNPYLRTEGFSTTIGGIVDDTQNGVIENTESENGVFRSSVLTVNNSSDFSYSGFVRNKSGGDSTGLLGLTKGGPGVLSLSGGNVNFTGDSTVIAGTLRIYNTTNWASNITTRAAANLELATIATDWQFNSQLVGGGGVVKTGPNMVTLTQDETYTGATTITGGGTLALTSGFNQGVATSGATSYTITLLRMPYPGTMFISDGTLGTTGTSTLAEPAGGFGVSTYSGTPGGTGSISGAIYNPATKVLTIKYSSAPPSGSTLRVNYQPADNQRIGNTDGVDKSFSATLISPPGGTSLLVTDGVDTWSQANATNNGGSFTGTSGPGGLFSVTYTSGTRLLAVTYVSTPAYGRAITALWTAGPGLLATSAINLANGNLLINNSPNPQITGGLQLNSTDRINNNAPINSTGGIISFSNGDPGGAASYTESLGALNLTSGLTTINTQPGGAGSSSALTFSMLYRADAAGSSVLFSGPRLGGSAFNQLLFTQPLTLGTNAGRLIGGWAVAQDATNYDFATYGPNGVTFLTASNSSRNVSIGSWSASVDAIIKANQVSTKDTIVNSVEFNDPTARTLSLGTVAAPRKLTINSGGMIFELATVPIISAFGTITGSLTPGGLTGNELDLWTTALTMSVQMGAVLANGTAGVNTVNSGMVVVKNGLGEVKLTGSNTYTGGTRVYGGDLDVASITSLGQVPGAAAIPSAPQFKADFLTLSGGTIQLSAGVVNGQPTSPVLNFDTNHGIVLGPASGTFALDPTSTVNINAPITGPGGLGVGSKTIFSSGGIINLYGTNTFQGTVTATSGTISFNSGSNSFTGGFSIGTSGTVVIHDSKTVPANQVVTMAGGFFTLGSSVTIGALSASVGSTITLQPDTTQGALPGTTTVLNPHQPVLLTINQLTNTTFAGTITDTVLEPDGVTFSPVTLGIEKKGAGVLTLTQALGDILSDYRGTTKISEGVLATSLLGFRGQASAIGTGGGTGFSPGDLARNVGSASLLYIENGAGLSYVGTNPVSSNRPFTIGVGALGAGYYANGVGLGNTVSVLQGRLFTVDQNSNVTDLGPDSIGFSKPNQAATLVLGGRNLGDNTFSMDLHDNGRAPLSLQKSGDGNWVMGLPLGPNVTLTHCTTNVASLPASSDPSYVVTCDSTAGLVVGMTVTGTGILEGTTVFQVNTGSPPSFVLSQQAAPLTLHANSGALTLTHSTFHYDPTGTTLNVVVCDFVAGMGVGFDITGPGIPSNTSVSAFTSDLANTQLTLTLSQAAIPVTVSMPVIGDSFSDFTGGTTIYLGTLAIQQNGVLGAPGGGPVQLLGGNLDLRNVAYTSSKTLAMDGGRLRSIIGSSSWAGPVVADVSSTIEVDTGSLLDLQGGISGQAGITKVGLGTLSLDGLNTFVGGMNVNEGTLQLDYTHNLGSKLANGATLTLGGGRSGATVNLVSLPSGASGNVEVVNTLSLGFGLNRITATPNGTTLRVNAIAIAQGATLDVQTFGPTTSAASSTRPNEANSGIIGTWATVTSGNVSDWAYNPNSTSSTSTTIGPFVAYTGYSTDTWAGLSSNVNVTTNSTPTTVNSLGMNAVASTLRYATNAATTLTLQQNSSNLLNDGGILQSASAGAVNNIITGGTLVLGNNAQGGNLVIQQYDALGGLQINSAIANALDITSLSITYSSAVVNRINLGVGLNTSTFYTGMVVTGPNIRPGSILNGITNTTAYTLSQNIASPLTFTQNGSATTPPPSTYTVTTQADGVPNEIRLSAPPPYQLVVGELVTDTGGYIPAGTVITAIVNPTAGVNATDYLVSNPLPVASSGVTVNINLWGELSVGNVFVMAPPTFQFTAQTANPNEIVLSSTPAVPLVVGEQVSDAVTAGGQGLIPPGTTVTTVVSPTDYLLSNNLTGTTSADTLTRSTMAYQVHLSVGGTSGITTGSSGGTAPSIAVGQTVSGLGIPSGATVIGLVPGSTTDFYFTFNQTRSLIIGGHSTDINGVPFVGNIAVGNGGLQVHLLNGGTTSGMGSGAAVPVIGTDIQPGTFVSGLVAGTTDFTLSISVFSPVVNVTVSGHNGLLKAGPGTAQLGGVNTFTGPVTISGGALSVPQVTNGGVPGTLGASTSAAANITIGGGTLRYTGDSATVDRGFTINSQGAIDVANKGVTLNFTGNLSGGTGAALGILQKTGAGTLALSRSVTTGGATNFGGFEVDGGALQLVYIDPNDPAASATTPVSDKFAASANNATLTLGGGKFELVGVATAPVLSGTDFTEDRVQNLLGQFTLNTGASQVWVTSAPGSNTTLNLQNGLAPTDVARQPGGTVLFVENPNGGASANITLAVNSIDQATVLPWATYLDTSFVSQPGVNNFASLEPADDGVISADSKRLYTTTSDVSAWGSGQTVSESGTAFSGFTPSNLEVYAMRFFAQAAGVVNITDNMVLAGGAILAGANSGNNSKIIQGGLITSGLNDPGTKQNDFIIHNYNPVSPLQIASQIADNSFVSPHVMVNLVHTGTGTTILWGNNSPLITDPHSTLGNVGDPNPLYGENTYSGTTYLTGGVLRLGTLPTVSTTAGTVSATPGAALPGGILASASGVAGAGNLVLDGGVLGISSSFTRILGTGLGQVQFTGSGGFAAYVADATVNFGGSLVPAPVVWGANGFVPESSELMLSSSDATNTITIANPINLGGFARVVDVANGAAAVDAIFSGGLSGNGGSIRKTGFGTLRLTGGSGTQTGGAVLGQGTLSTSANALGIGVLAGPLGIGNTDLTNANNALVLELRGGTFNSSIIVGNKNTSGITTINATSSPTLNGPMILGRNIFFGPQAGRKITLNGGITGTGGFTVVDGGVVALNGPATFPGAPSTPGTTQGPAVDGAAVIRAGALYLGNSTALGNANVELGDTTTTAPFSVDRTSAGRSVLLQGGSFDPRSLGRPGTSNGRGGFIFPNTTVTIDNRIYTEADSMLDGIITPGDLFHKRTLILLNGEDSSPDRNGIYELVYAHGDSFNLSPCVTSLNPAITLVNIGIARSQFTVTTGIGGTRNLLVGMTVSNPTLLAAGSKVQSIIDDHTFVLSLAPIGTGTGNLVFTIGSNTVTCSPSDPNFGQLVIGMPVSGPNIPVGASVTGVFPSVTDPNTGLPTTPSFTISAPAIAANSSLVLTFRAGDTIGLNRIAEFDQDSEMTYGTRVFVKNDGTGATDTGKTFFLAADVHVTFGAVTLTSAATTINSTTVTCASTAGLVIGMQVAESGVLPSDNVDLAPNATITGIVDTKTFIVNSPSQLTAGPLTLIATINPPVPQFSPTWWKVDTLDPNIGLLASTSGLTIGNSIDINGPTGFGVTSLGGAASLSSGSSTFNGNVVLQNAARLITNASTLPSSTTVNCDNTGSLLVGMTISGANIPANATVVSITSPTAFVISAPATVKATVTSLTATLNRTVRLLSNTLDPGGVVFNGIFSEANNSGDLLGLQKLGTGVVTLTGANTYQGGTSVLSGSLIVDNTIGSGTGTGAVTVSNLGSLLGGNGTISGPTTLSAGAILSPGDPKYGGTGNLNFNNGLTLGLGASVNFDLGSGGSPLDYDTINVTGQFRVDPTVAFDVLLNFPLPDPNGPNASDFTFNLLQWTPGNLFATGNLSSQLDLPSLLSGYYWDTSLFNSSGEIILKLRQPGAPPVARFAVSSAHVIEGEMSVKVAVELDTPVPSNSSGITVPLVLGGTATQGVDYDLVQPSVAFIRGSTSADVTILVHDNALAQPTRTLVLSLGTPSPAGTLLIGSPASFTLRIEDNDSSVPLGTRWKVRNPLPTNETLLGVTQLGSKIFAVGTSGTLLTSTDGGTTWSRVALGINPTLHAIASTPNITPAITPAVPLIVAVGDDGNIVTSPDGVVWTYRNASGAKALQSVIWVDTLSLFVAAGQGGLIFTSPDGASWTSQNSTISSDLESVSYGNATLVAVGKNGVIITSTDVQAASWAQATSNTNHWLRSVAFNASKFAAVGDGGALVTSANGSSWTVGSILSTTANLRSVHYDGARFIVAGAGGVVFYSVDGTTWNSPAVPFGVTADLQAGVSLSLNSSILVGSSGTIVTTSTGTSFAKSAASSGPIDDFQAITYNGTQFIAVGKNGRIATSAATTTPTVNPAGNVWTVRTTPGAVTGVRLASVAYKPGQILAVGDNGNVVTSPDGVTWTASSASVAVNLHDVIYTNGAYFAVGDADLIQGTILKNTTGTTWTPLTSNTTENLQGIASTSDGSLMVVVGDVGANGGTILTSSDGGVTWEDNTPGGLPALKAITWTGSQFIIVGAGGTLLTTPDGINLTAQNSFVTADLSGVTWTGTTALVVGARGTVLSSPDGLSWTVLDAGTSQDLTAVAYNSTATRLAVVGAAGSILTSDPVVVPAPSVYFASATMTVDDLIGTANVPITISGIPSTDLHITFTIVPDAGVPTTAYSAVSPFVIKASGISQSEISAGIFTRNLPIKLTSNAIKTAKSLTITMTSLAAADNAGLVLPTRCILTVTPAVAPTITLNPATQNQMVALGSAFSLTANVTGSTPITQWLKNGLSVLGATNPVYHVAAATTLNAGKYTAKATNVVGTSLTTTGQTAPAGTAEISVVDQTNRIVLVKVGLSTTFTAVAAGDGLTYAWFKVGTGLLTNTTNPAKFAIVGPKLTVKTIGSGDEGTFYCQVSQTTTPNTGLTANTGNFSLYVAAVPDIVVPPSIPEGRVGAAYSLPITRASNDPHMTPVTYTASGLPTGLTINASTGVISGIPTVAGSFSLAKVTATNAAGSTILHVFTIVIDPIDAGALGAFVGLVDRSGAPTPGSTVASVIGTLGLGARFDLATLANSSYTGKLTIGPTAYAFLGKLVTSAVADPSPHNPQGQVTVLRTGKSTLTIAFSLDPATNLLSGTVTDGSTSASITGWRNEWKTLAPSPNPALVAGLHNFIADVPGGPPTNGSQPEGSSYGGLTIAAAGTTTILGKTADGNALATTGVMGPTGQVLVYQSLYVLPGTFCGIINIDTSGFATGGTLTAQRTQQATGSLTWSHPAQTATTNRTFKNGWLQPITLGVDGGLYYPASFGAIVMSLQDNTGSQDLTNAQLNFTGGNVTGTAISPSLNAANSKLFQVKSLATPVIPANATSTTLVIDNTHGTFSGSFTLTDPDPTSTQLVKKPAVVRKVLFQGIIIPNTLTTDTFSDGVGYGYFLLPELPSLSPVTTPTTSPILSGLAIFESK